MDKEQIARQLASMKGLAGSGSLLAYLADKIEGLVATMEPGDFVRSETNSASAAPVASDVWYLYYHDNLLKKYRADEEADFNHYDYSTDLADNYSFMESFKPLRVLTDLAAFDIDEGFGEIIPAEYKNNGIHWINTLAHETWGTWQKVKYPSAVSSNEYCGYIAFPVGQLGVMEVIAIMKETEISGYKFTAVDSNSSYLPKEKPVLKDDEKPTIQSPPEMFPDMKDANGNALAGQNYCYGQQIVISAYLMQENVEYPAVNQKDYEAAEPKKWMRYWVKKKDTFPVPGEFIGILTRPVACPPHLWWFQESSPFLYAGNWMETRYLTSGVVTSVSQDYPIYGVKVQGCEVMAYASDFFSYKVGDRVAIAKIYDMSSSNDAYTWLDQTHLKTADKGTGIFNYMIIPATFYKLKGE